MKIPQQVYGAHLMISRCTESVILTAKIILIQRMIQTREIQETQTQRKTQTREIQEKPIQRMMQTREIQETQIQRMM